LNRYFQTAPGDEIGSGRQASGSQSVPANSMIVTSGLTASDPRADYRRTSANSSTSDSPAQKLAFIHQILGRDMAEVRMFFERIETFLGSLSDVQRQAPAFMQAMEVIARDKLAREHYLAFARGNDQLAIRARMMDVARTVGWLSPEEQTAELIRMIGDQLAGNTMSSAEVGGCSRERTARSSIRAASS
jgi:hypothetical protein